jgi:O-antigen/teichoic acid export membrane protein
LIGSFLAIASVSFFSVAENLVSTVGRILGSVSGVLMPTVSALERQNQLTAICSLITNTTRYLVAIALLAFLNFLFAGYQFLDLWLSREFAEHSWQLLLVLSISLAFTYPHGVALNALSGLGFPNIVNRILWMDAIAIIVGFFVVIPFGGIFEISVAYFIGRSVVFLYFIPKNICEKISMKPYSYLLSVYTKPALISLPTALLFVVSKHYFPLDGWLALICTCVAMSTFFCISAWYFVLENADRTSLLEELGGSVGLVRNAFVSAKAVVSRAEPLGKDAD